jgi:hypothetical protein
VLRNATLLLAVGAISLLSPAARCDDTVPANSNSLSATEFVVAVAMSDLAKARAGQPHGLSYAKDETGMALATAIRKWLAGRGDAGLHLDSPDRLTLFAFLWSAQQMSSDSPCFSSPDSDACESELAYWLDEVRSGSPSFVGAYKKAEGPLKLPALKD